MKATMLILMGCFLLLTSNMATAAATDETSAAVKAKEIADSANAEAEAEAAEASKAADVASKAAEAAVKAAAAAKAAAAVKMEKAKAAAIKAQEKTAAAKKTIAVAAKRGARSCDEWTQERASKTSNGPVLTWLNGFLSGIEVAKNKDFLSSMSDKSMYSSIDAYCEAHPLEFVSDAGIHLYLELARKKGLIE